MLDPAQFNLGSREHLLLTVDQEFVVRAAAATGHKTGRWGGASVRGCHRLSVSAVSPCRTRRGAKVSTVSGTGFPHLYRRKLIVRRAAGSSRTRREGLMPVGGASDGGAGPVQPRCVQTTPADRAATRPAARATRTWRGHRWRIRLATDAPWPVSDSLGVAGGGNRPVLHGLLDPDMSSTPSYRFRAGRSGTGQPTDRTSAQRPVTPDVEPEERCGKSPPADQGSGE